MAEHADAIASLDGVARIEGAVRARSGWYAGYLWVFAAWQLIVVPVVVLWPGPASAIGICLANAVLVTGLSMQVLRQPVVPRGFGGRHLRVIGTWSALYALTVALSRVFEGSVPFAAIAALGCALPLAVGAWRVQRRRSA